MKSCRTCVHWQHAIDFTNNNRNPNHVHTYVVGAYHSPGICFSCAKDQSTNSQLAKMRAMVKQMLADQGYTGQQSDVWEEHEPVADAEYEAAYDEAWVVAENAVLHNHGRNCSSYELCPECLLLIKVG